MKALQFNSIQFLLYTPKIQQYLPQGTYHNLLHSQSILAHRFSAVFVAAGLLLEEEAFREPQGAVLSFSASN